MTNKVIHLAHCVYTNGEIDYEWTKDVESDFHTLPNLYAISLIKVNGSAREVLSTVVVKTNLSQTKESIGQIYGAMINSVPRLKSLPTSNVTLTSTKANIPQGIVPNESELLKIMTDMYTQNAVSGHT